MRRKGNLVSSKNLVSSLTSHYINYTWFKSTFPIQTKPTQSVSRQISLTDNYTSSTISLAGTLRHASMQRADNLLRGSHTKCMFRPFSSSHSFSMWCFANLVCNTLATRGYITILMYRDLPVHCSFHWRKSHEFVFIFKSISFILETMGGGLNTKLSPCSIYTDN